MPRASLTITIPGDLWIGDLSRRFPETTLAVQSVRSADGLGVALVRLHGPSVGPVLDALADRPAVAAVEPFRRDGDDALVQVEATDPFLLSAIEAAGVPIRSPLEIRDGTVTWDPVTTRDRLSGLAEHLDGFGIDYEVDRVSAGIDAERVLTETQARVVRAALDRGYYDSPRTCTLTELADHLDLAASTCSDTLHRAEERIVKRFEEEPTGLHPEPGV